MKCNQDTCLEFGCLLSSYRYIGDNAEVVVLKHAGHAPQLEKAKDYNRVLMTFLRQVSLSPKSSL
jgi:pimeloyl-ACP methyl ester carboxylesterase